MEAFHHVGTGENDGGIAQTGDTCPWTTAAIGAIDGYILQTDYGIIGNRDLIVAAELARQDLTGRCLVITCKGGDIRFRNDRHGTHVTGGAFAACRCRDDGITWFEDCHHARGTDGCYRLVARRPIDSTENGIGRRYGGCQGGCGGHIFTPA